MERGAVSLTIYLQKAVLAEPQPVILTQLTSFTQTGKAPVDAPHVYGTWNPMFNDRPQRYNIERA